MAPGRKKGANKSNRNAQLSLGDLVLAKVKGYPAWPAKIGQPEEWGKAPEPKKYFVEFFGTREIGFVGASDIQVFTSETKNKLLARSHGNKYFSQAVKEICIAFEVCQRNKSKGAVSDLDGSTSLAVGDMDGLTSAAEALPVNKIQDGGSVTNLHNCMGVAETCVEQGMEVDDCSSKLEFHLQGRDESSSGNMDTALGDVNVVSSPVTFSEKDAEISDDLDKCFRVKDEVDAGVNEATNCFGNVDKVEKKWTISYKSKKRIKGAIGVHETGEFGLKALQNGKFGGPVVDEQLEGAIEQKLDALSGKEVKYLPEHKSAVESDGISENVEMPSAEMPGERSVQSGLRKPKTERTETLHPANNCELVEAQEDTKESQSRPLKCESKNSDVTEKKAFGKSRSSEKIEIVMALRAQKGRVKSNVSAEKVNLKLLVPSQTGKVKLDAQTGKIRSVLSAHTGKSKPYMNAEKVKLKSKIPPLPGNFKPDNSTDETVLPLSKRRRLVIEAISDSSDPDCDDKGKKVPLELENDSSSNNILLSATQLSKRRRAVRLYDDDDNDGKPKTPIHGGFSKNVEGRLVVSDISKGTNGKVSVSVDQQRRSSVNSQLRSGNSTGVENKVSKKFSAQSNNEGNPPGQSKSPLRSDSHVSRSLKRLEDQPFSSKEAQKSETSPKGLSCLLPANQQNKATKTLIEVSNFGNQKDAPAGSTKGVALVLEDSGILNDASSKRDRLMLSRGRSKTTLQTTSNMSDSVALAETSTDLGADDEQRRGSIVDLKTPDSAMSMKHLIAAAQAKRRQAHTQKLYVGSHNPAYIHANDAQRRSPNRSPVQPLPFSKGNTMHTDRQGSLNLVNPVSPSTSGRQSAPCNQEDVEEVGDQKVSTRYKITEGTSSASTEAAVARDAFQGMIETLSRTKESIRRATRLAIDCAKYGIANEVVELLIQKLESEPSFHRKVDLFFLVDSITQSSHNQKGIAGASYIPAVQEALPRLLGAAAVPGAAGRENRRQYRKILRLWLERKIFPKSILRRYIDDIEITGDGTSAKVSLRRPSRTERAIDDPIREIEGMLVDEYGSNATFELPGFLSSNVFEDNEDLFMEDGDALSPTKPVDALRDLETCSVGPSDRRHLTLKDVDGELEMEDASGRQKDERLASASSELNAQQHHSERTFEAVQIDSHGFPTLPDGSPPLPSDPLPPLPPLPLSPPPPLPSLSLPPPPPLLLSLPPPPPPPPIQPSLLPQPILAPQSSLQCSPHLSYQSAGNQNVQVVGDTAHRSHGDGATKIDQLPQQSPSFPPKGSSGFNSRQLEYGHNNVYLNSQASQQTSLYQPGNTPFMQRSLHPNLPQTASGHFVLTNPATQQHPQHSYTHPYPLPSHPDGQRQFVSEQWRMPCNEFNTDNRTGAWRMPSQGGPSFGPEGYFQPPTDRMGFQLSTSNLPAGTPISGQGVPQMLPYRPDISALNCWRPA